MTSDFYPIFASLSSVSALGCLLVIFIYYRYTSLQLFAYKLVRDLAIFDLSYSLVWLIPPYWGVSCNLQGFLMSGTSLTTVLWTAVISNTLLQRVLLQRELNEEKYERRSIAAVLTVSWIVAIVPYFALVWSENPYGDSGGWCWVRQNQNTHLGWLWRLVTFYIPFFLVVIFNTTVNAFVIKKLNVAEASRKMGARLAMYSVILFICFMPAAVLRMYYYIHNYENSDALILAAGVLSCLIGLLDSVVYGFTRSVREELKKSILGSEEELMQTIKQED